MIHTDLEVYKKSMLLVKKVYQLTSNLPPSEMYCLSQQMRRAAISIPSNIAEGCARQSSKELAQFLNISLGSLAELETQIEISKMLSFISETSTLEITKEITIVRKMLLNLKKSICTPSPIARVTHNS